MNNYAVDKLLNKDTKTVLPECRYCKSRCYECIYFKKHSNKVDSEGKSHCAYWGEWRYPSDGCANGTDRWTYQKEKDEEAARLAEERVRREKQEEIWNETERRRNFSRNDGHRKVGNTGVGTQGSSGNGAGAGGIVLLLIAGIAILFSMGIIKPTITFKMDGPQISPNQYPSYALNVVRMDDDSNSYPKNFNGYTADSDVFNEYGKSSIDLKKGGYDIWISHDGVSGFAGNVDVNNVFDKTVSVNPENVQNGSMRMAIIYLQDQSRNAVATKNLLITDNDGNKISCTSYKDDGCYLLVIPDSKITQSVITVTVQADGFEKCGLELDFSQGRTVDGKVTLTSK